LIVLDIIIGFHQRRALLSTLQAVRIGTHGEVEHETQVIRAVRYVLDPGAGGGARSGERLPGPGRS
jgi:excinuclease UvrABC ATPase subunit